MTDDANYLAHLNLGVDLAAQGRSASLAGAVHLEIEENPGPACMRATAWAGCYYNLGRKDEAVIEQFAQVLALVPRGREAAMQLWEYRSWRRAGPTTRSAN